METSFEELLGHAPLRCDRPTADPAWAGGRIVNPINSHRHVRPTKSQISPYLSWRYTYLAYQPGALLSLGMDSQVQGCGSQNGNSVRGTSTSAWALQLFSNIPLLTSFFLVKLCVHFQCVFSFCLIRTYSISYIKFLWGLSILKRKHTVLRLGRKNYIYQFRLGADLLERSNPEKDQEGCWYPEMH